MILPLITSTIVSIVEGTWIVSSILLKYLLIGLVAKNLYQGSFTIEGLRNDILGSSELVVSSLVVVGAVVAVSGLSPSPVLKLFSELVALGYFGYLFWKY
ncbi:MAG: hypothetical protein ABEK04_03870 [Candidatus Nanohalobium sp.]